MTTPYRWVAGLLAGLLVALAGIAYRTHLIDTAHQAGVVAEQARAAEVIRKLAQADAVAADESRVRHEATLQSLKETHDRTVRHLSLALADSDHRNQRLSGRIAGLLDEAAGLRPDPAAAPAAPGGAPGTDEADPPDSTVADLIETAHGNAATCLRNSARLVELQQFYNGRRGE